MDTIINREHWEKVYETKSPDDVSWTQPVPATSLSFIHSFGLPKTAEIIDTEVQSIIAEQYKRAKKIISNNKENHAQLSQLLIEKEVIFAEDMEQIFGKRPWASRMDELISESEKNKINTSTTEATTTL